MYADAQVKGDEITIADIAVVCTVTWIEWADTRPGWKEQYPVLAKWVTALDERKEFADTRPVMFDLKEDVV
jgi:glutathione S-transferase